MSVNVESITSWDKEYKADPLVSFASTVLRNTDPKKAVVSQQSKQTVIHEFSDVIETEGSPMTNQKSSGRCWLFAATNVYRIALMKKYNITELQLSQSYLFFWDKLEKSNFFLDQIIDTAKEDVDSRLVQHLLTDPIGDGGQYDMVVSLVEKYGLVPQHAYPDVWSCTNSREVDEHLTTQLRQYAQELRDAVSAGKDAHAIRQKQIKEVYRLLVLFFGAPPNANDKITWEYKDKDKKYFAVETTPLKFYKEVLGHDATKEVSLVHDPRNKTEKLIKVDRLGNVVGNPYVTYINLEIEDLAKFAIEKIKNNEPVFFGSHTPKYLDLESGIFDLDVWNYKVIGINPTQNKADRLRYKESLMTHAMVLTGVHLVDGKPTRWRVENSWGDERGKKGYFVMTHDYFKEYVYQIVADKEKIGDLVKILDDKEPVVLPPWDPMGALAK